MSKTETFSPSTAAFDYAAQRLQASKTDSTTVKVGKGAASAFVNTALTAAALTETIALAIFTAIAALPLYALSKKETLDSLVGRVQIGAQTTQNAFKAIAGIYPPKPEAPESYGAFAWRLAAAPINWALGR